MTGLEFYPPLSLLILSDKNPEVRGAAFPYPFYVTLLSSVTSSSGRSCCYVLKKQDLFGLADSFLADASFMVGGDGLEYPREYDDRAAGQ